MPSFQVMLPVIGVAKQSKWTSSLTMSCSPRVSPLASSAPSRPSTPSPAPAPPAPKVEEINVERLVGRWLRPDGGYILQIRRGHANGHLDAAYLNPRPINVARAKWQRKDGTLQVFVELRDVNYPGSTYTLDYVLEQDRLVGAYFQAVQQQTFDVEFVRQK